MDEKKLNSLISTLIKMESEQEQPMKYNAVISELLKAEGITNFSILNHRGGTVVSFQNKEGGITLLGE